MVVKDNTYIENIRQIKVGRTGRTKDMKTLNNIELWKKKSKIQRVKS